MSETLSKTAGGAASVTIEPLKPLVGGLVHVDKAHLTDPGVIEKLRAALEERGVLVFPQINLTDQEQLAFTDAFGERINFTKRAPGADQVTPDVYQLTLDKTINAEPDYVLGTFFWHVDGVTIDIPLPKATVLSARTLSDTGGATEFSNVYAAYAALPDDEKAELDGLQVVHTVEAAVRPVYGHPPQERIERYRTMAPGMTHPLVWTHESGRKSLLLGTHADGVVGWKAAQGRALLWRLQQWAAESQFVYRHHWKVGDLVIWDNQGLMHRVVPYSDERRIMHRTSVGGRERPGRVAKPEELAKLFEPL